MLKQVSMCVRAQAQLIDVMDLIRRCSARETCHKLPPKFKNSNNTQATESKNDPHWPQSNVLDRNLSEQIQSADRDFLLPNDSVSKQPRYKRTLRAKKTSSVTKPIQHNEPEGRLEVYESIVNAFNRNVDLRNFYRVVSHRLYARFNNALAVKTGEQRLVVHPSLLLATLRNLVEGLPGFGGTCKLLLSGVAAVDTSLKRARGEARLNPLARYCFHQDDPKWLALAFSVALTKKYERDLVQLNGGCRDRLLDSVSNVFKGVIIKNYRPEPQDYATRFGELMADLLVGYLALKGVTTPLNSKREKSWNTVEPKNQWIRLAPNAIDEFFHRYNLELPNDPGESSTDLGISNDETSALLSNVEKAKKKKRSCTLL